MLINELPRYEILDEHSMQELERGWRRIVSELGVDFGTSEPHEETIAVLEAAGQKVEGQLVKLDPDWVLEQVAKAPREFDLQARNPANNIHIGGKHMAFGAVYGCPFVREGIERREATYADFENLVAPVAGVPAARHARRDDLRAERQAARLPPSRHGLRADDAVGQAVHGLGDVGAERGGHDRDGGDGVRARVARADAGDDQPDQRQLAASLRRADAGGAARVRESEPGDGDHAVPADGRDVAGVGRLDARATGGRGARGHRARADDPARLPRRLRLVPVEHRHAVGLAQLRHARVRGRPALHRPDRAPLRAAVPRRRQRSPRRRRSTRRRRTRRR